MNPNSHSLTSQAKQKYQQIPKYLDLERNYKELFQ